MSVLRIEHGVADFDGLPASILEPAESKEY
jgi:hypothetical protein